MVTNYENLKRKIESHLADPSQGSVDLEWLIDYLASAQAGISTIISEAEKREIFWKLDREGFIIEPIEKDFENERGHTEYETRYYIIRGNRLISSKKKTENNS